MRLKRGLGAALCAAMLLQNGCTAITQDLRNPGGYPGYLLDKHSINASRSKQLLLLRASIIVAMAARMSNGTIQNPDEADGVANYLSAATDEINYAAADIYPVGGIAPCAVGPRVVTPPNESTEAQLAAALHEAQTSAASANAAAARAESDVQAIEQQVPRAPDAPPPPLSSKVPLLTGCYGYYVNFESEMPLLEGRVIRLMYSTLPQDRIKSFASDVQKGNILGGAWDALKLVFVGIKGLHSASASYRSGEEAVVVNIPGHCKGRRPETEMTVYDAVSCLGLSHDSLFGTQPGELGPDQLPQLITPQTFDAILTIARTSCVRLPLGSGTSRGPDLVEAANTRRKTCNNIFFDPKSRPDQIG